MFTGLVQQTGIIKGLERNDGGWSAQIGYTPWPDPLVLGESVAVQGACLTVTSIRPDFFTADLLDETLQRTALRQLRTGAKVNLERALAVGDRLGGHWVSGHVDECGKLISVTPAGRDEIWRIGCSAALAGQSVMKGSATLDGVSLTISGLGDDWFEVNLIPHTRSVTSLSERRIGDLINLEGDILGKYVARLLGKDRNRAIDEQLLSENGFI